MTSATGAISDLSEKSISPPESGDAQDLDLDHDHDHDDHASTSTGPRSGSGHASKMGEMLGVAKDVAAVVFNERVKQDDGAGTTWKESFIDASRFFPLLAALWVRPHSSHSTPLTGAG